MISAGTISTTISEVANVIKSIAEVGTAVVAVTDAIGLTEANKIKPIDTKTYSGISVNDVTKSICNLCDVVSNVSDKNGKRAFSYVGPVQSK